jgi:DEAD/DEAH box helicase domain-containing protein
MADKIVFDIETKNSFADVGGRDNFRNLDVSMVCAYSYDKDEYFSFDENELYGFGELARHAGLLVTFNGKQFDVPVMEKYYTFKLSAVPHYDIFEEVVAKLGRRIGLGPLSEANLKGGEGKTASGMDAILFYQRGEMEKLRKYCIQDVKVTKDIFDLICTQGHLWIPDKYNPKMTKLEVTYTEVEEPQNKLL